MNGDGTVSAIVDPRSFDGLSNVAAYIRNTLHLAAEPTIAIVCGSGFSHVAELLKDVQYIEFDKIQGLPLPTVEGHVGRFVFGWYEGQYVVLQQGRIHPYEQPNNFALSAMPVRLMWLLGARTLLLTNAVGAVDETLRTGDFVVYSDQIFIPGMVGNSPLTGSHDSRWGARFVATNQIYDPTLRERVLECARKQEIRAREGVYVMLCGPAYESPAELRFLRLSGAHVVGMSVAHEALVAHQMGMRTLAIGLVTNDLSDTSVPLSHDEVQTAAAAAASKARALIAGLLASSSSS